MYCIKHLLHIDAPKVKIFKALTTIEGLSNWWTSQTSGNSRLNGILTFRFGAVYHNEMKVTKIENNSLVQWLCIKGEKDWIGTLLSFELDENENKTRLRFKHDKWPTHDDFFAHCSFSWGRYLESLRNLAETGQGNPFKLK